MGKVEDTANQVKARLQSLSPSLPGHTIDLDTDRDPWERQSTEGDLSWSMFQYYRNTPPHRRRLSTVYAEFALAHPDLLKPAPSAPSATSSKEEQAPKPKRSKAKTANATNEGFPNPTGGVPAQPPSPAQSPAPLHSLLGEANIIVPSWFDAMAALYRWEYRAIEFDRWLDDIQRADLKFRRENIRSEISALGQAMRSKAVEALNVLQSVIYQTTVEDDGKVSMQIKPNLTVNEILKLAEAGLKFERFALGMEQVGTQVNVGVVAEAGSTVTVNDADLVARAKAVLAAREGGVIALAGPGSVEGAEFIEGEYSERKAQ